MGAAWLALLSKNLPQGRKIGWVERFKAKVRFWSGARARLRPAPASSALACVHACIHAHGHLALCDSLVRQAGAASFKSVQPCAWQAQRVLAFQLWPRKFFAWWCAGFNMLDLIVVTIWALINGM